MADQLFMFITTGGTMIALAVLLFVSKGLRMRSGGLAVTASSSLSSNTAPSSSDNKSYNNAGKKVKKYSSDGRPIYED
jgi:hypothetical protein